MKVSLAGLIRNAGNAARAGDKMYGGMFAYSLEELQKHIEETVRGEHTLEEFADFYCIDRARGEEKGEQQ